MIAAAFSTPAAANVGGSLVIASDDRFRGASTSDGRPVATAALSLDDRSGLYGGVSVTAGGVRDEGIRLLRSVQYVGYARRVAPSVSVDVGAVRRAYDRYATIEYGRSFAELYAGLVGRRLSAHIFHAPNYDGWGHDASYAQVEGTLLEHGRVTLSLHLGGLRPPRIEGLARAMTVDWRLSVTWRPDQFAALSLTWVGAGQGYDRYSQDRRTGRREALLLSISRAF
ncbi:TorF family putative porin [Sphingomonas sp. DT-51]|uniref:TorF family putative porin n=1 Tax=Sphingomonas sp. DT-51 TaxID=3396165 RepID=UPI003F5402AC